jgi:uncharacterized glyoxalase superfamily protein PhnB
LVIGENRYGCLCRLWYANGVPNGKHIMQPTEVSPIAPGYRSITPYLMVDDVAAFLAFLRTAFDAQVIRQYDGPGGTIGHAEVRMADSAIMIGDPTGKHPRMPAGLYYYVTNVDTVYKQALEAGAVSVSASPSMHSTVTVWQPCRTSGTTCGGWPRMWKM